MMNIKEAESECRGKTSTHEEISNFIEKTKLEKNCKKQNGENSKKKIADRNTRCEEKKHVIKLKCNKRNENEVCECAKKVIKSKREELRKGSEISR